VWARWRRERQRAFLFEPCAQTPIAVSAAFLSMVATPNIREGTETINVKKLPTNPGLKSASISVMMIALPRASRTGGAP
jgi:hypothetical protein